MPMGNRPYKTKVNKAPSTVPWGESASTIDIISTTYIHAMATRYMPQAPVLAGPHDGHRPFDCADKAHLPVITRKDCRARVGEFRPACRFQLTNAGPAWPGRTPLL